MNFNFYSFGLSLVELLLELFSCFEGVHPDDQRKSDEDAVY
jgi:hypothetical protein